MIEEEQTPTLVGRLLGWSLRKVGLSTLLTLILLTIIIEIAANSLQDQVRGLYKTPLGTTAILALLLGWILARSRLSGWLAGLYTAISGVIVLTIQAGKLGSKLVALIPVVAKIINQAFYWQRGDPPIDVSLFLLIAKFIQEDIVFLYEKVLKWFTSLTGTPIYQPGVALLVWGLLLWCMAAWAAWAVRRRSQPFTGVLPVLSLLTISLAFSRSSAILLTPVLACTILLMAWINLQGRLHQWQRLGIDYAEDIHFDAGFWGIGIALGVAAMALVLSFISPQQIFDFIQQLGQSRSESAEKIGESLGLEVKQPTPAILPFSGIGCLPRDHLLGAGPELSHELVMVVSLDQPPAPYSQVSEAPAYYWRASTFDIYTGSGWINSTTTSTSYKADENAYPPKLTGHKLVHLNIQVLGEPDMTLYSAGILVSANQDFQLDRRLDAQGDQLSDDIFGASFTGQNPASYSVDSLVPLVGEAQLQAAGGSYPQWVLDRYLQLPETVPQRVINLARQVIAQGAMPDVKVTAYEKARKLESFLRQYPYSLEVPKPPPGRDVVEYFLFDLKKGYCDYYATAMVVMSRAVGLPARLVIGYAAGSYDAQLARYGQLRYVVTQAEAHSWVEIYYPGIGWVEFEPTGGLSEIVRPQDIPLQRIPAISAVYAQAGGLPQPAWQGWLRRAGFGLALLVSAVLAWQTTDRWRLRRLNASEALFALYKRFYKSGRRLGVSPQPGDTPHEIAAALTSQLDQLTKGRRTNRTLKATSSEVRQLVDLYARSAYSPYPADRKTQDQAINLWYHLRRRLGAARIFWLVQSKTRSILAGLKKR